MGADAPDRFLSALRRELRHGVLPVWILESLEGGPSYGYELLERLRSRHGDDAAASPSRLYPALARLRAHGLVRAYHGKESRGPVRKYYELTATGRAILPEIRTLALTLRTLSGPSPGGVPAVAAGAR